MKKILFIIIVFLTLKSNAQPDEGKYQIQYNITEDLVYGEDFTGAIRLYKQMLLFDENNPTFYYKLGFAYLNTFNKQDSAVIFLRQAEKLYTDKYRAEISPYEIKFYLARAYRLTNNIDSSIILLENLRNEVYNEQFLNSVNTELEITKQQINNLFTIEELDSIINSSYTEHSPIYSEFNKTLIFTSRRNNPNSTKYDDGQFDEDIYFSKRVNGKWSEPQIINIVSSSNNDATSSISTNGKELLMYRDEEDGSIYKSSYIDSSWSEPQKLPRPINSVHRETHASITNDGRIIFFASDRPGGHGGLDIWASVKDEFGKWSKPKNLGDAINSSGDEDSPNISLDGKTLFFSSNGRGNSYGGFDIYRSDITEFNTWGIAKNMGYPINSIGDDIFFTPIQSTNKAFYTSYRYGSHGAADIFIVYLDSICQRNLTINFGYLYDKDDTPIKDADITITNTLTNERKIAKATTKGKFIFVTKADNSYLIQVKLKNKVVYSDKFTMQGNVPEQNFYKKIKIE